MTAWISMPNGRTWSRASVPSGSTARPARSVTRSSWNSRIERLTTPAHDRRRSRVGFATGLTPGLVTAIVVALGAGSLLLAPAIVVGYAVKAADRDDQEANEH